MKFAIASIALFVATAIGQSTLQINTPANVVECQPTLLTWSGGTPPYFLSILPGNSPSSPALQDLGQQTGTSFTWETNIAAGTSIGLTLRDSTGAIAQSAAFTINPGSSSACLTSSSSAAGSSSVSASSVSSSSSSGSGSSSAVATTPAGTTTPAATTTSIKPAISSSSGTSRTGTATGAAASSSSGAGKINAANMGVAGIVGAAVMAILA